MGHSFPPWTAPFGGVVDLWTTRSDSAKLAFMPQYNRVPEDLLSTLAGTRIHFVGIKGTGMTALAEIMHNRGALVTGSDVPEEFYTDRILSDLGLTVHTDFSAKHIHRKIDLVVHSAAYGEDNPEIAAADQAGLPRYTYPEILGALSRRSRSLAVSGVHGKTTTAALTGMVARELGIPATVVVGSAVEGFGDRATLQKGERYLIAETCEYRRHFLYYFPTVLLITSVEPDHQDFFPTREDMYNAFIDFGRNIVPEGTLVYCADDSGAAEVAQQISRNRPDVTVVSYGTEIPAEFQIQDIEMKAGEIGFSIRGVPGEWTLRMPGRHLVLNTAGALLSLRELLQKDGIEIDWSRARRGIYRFSGVKRRSEFLGEVDGVLFIDDYGHHPTAIRTTLSGYREFYPGRRIVVDFMSHTVSRTAALLSEFGSAFSDADIVLVNDIYTSARETGNGTVSVADLAQEIGKHHPQVFLEPDFSGAEERALGLLRRGDIFVTMGAGDNFRVAESVKRRMEINTK